MWKWLKTKEDVNVTVLRSIDMHLAKYKWMLYQRWELYAEKRIDAIQLKADLREQMNEMYLRLKELIDNVK